MKTLLLAGLLALTAAAPADALRDPTRPPTPVRTSGKSADSVPQLSAILGAGQNLKAIVNGRLVRSGESVGGYEIEAVFEDGVRYRRGGVSREQHLQHLEGFKKPSTAAARAPLGEH